MVCHYSKLEMMQVKWDESKWKMLNIQWDGGNTFLGGPIVFWILKNKKYLILYMNILF